MKRTKEQCPLCSANIEEYPIHFNTTFSMCENTQCSYPFNTNDFMNLLHTDELKSKKKQRIVKKSLETNVSSLQQQSQPKKSVQGKKEDVNSSLPSSPTKQKDLSFDLALPSKTISKGSVLISTTTKPLPNHIPSINRNPLRNTSSLLPSPITVNKYNHMNNNINKKKNDHSHNNNIYSNNRTTLSMKSKGLNDISNSTNNYTLADIEVLLNEQDDNGSLVVTPEDTTFNNMMDPMIWLDNIVQDQQMQQNDLKFNPLQPDQDLDILLGINSPSV